MSTTAKSILFAKSTTIRPSSFLFQRRTFPLFSHPLCPFRSAPRTILACFDTLSINPSRSFQKIIFLLHAVAYLWSIRAYYVQHRPFTSSFIVISLPDTLFTSKTLSTSSFLTTILFHFFFHQLHCRTACSHLQCFSFYSLSIVFLVGLVWSLFVHKKLFF